MLRRLPRSRVARALLVPLVLVAAVLVGVGLGVSAAGGGAGASPANSLGVYVGYQSPSGVNAFGRDVGEKPSFAMDFLDGDSWSGMVNQAASYMAAWKNAGFTMIWGVPMLPYNSSGNSSGSSSSGSSGSGYTLQQGATGAYNSYFLQLAKTMVAGGEADSIIRIGWEFNGGWFPWAANGQAAAFIAYWQQIVDTMRSVPGQQFTFEWNPNLGDSGVGTLADYYPGNAYVDYIGLDVYDQAWGYYGAPGCSGTTCQQDQFNTILTEPGGLNWLASFASQQDKPIVLPEWGLGAFNPTDLNGTYQNEELGGGDDPTFINDMISWIDAHNVFEASYWDFQQDATSAVPASTAALLTDLSGGSLASSGSVSSGATGSAGTAGETGTGAVTSSSSGAFTPSLPNVFPQSSEADSTVTIDPPTAPVLPWKGAHFSAVVSTLAPGSATPTGPVTWAINSASGAAVPCPASSNVMHGKSGLTRCNVAPGELSSADGPYTVSVSYPGGSGFASSSASLTQPVGKANSGVRIGGVGLVRPGGSTALTASVVGLPASEGTLGGTVTFAFTDASGQPLSCVDGDTVELAAGAATCDTTAVASAGAPYFVTATYGGNSSFNASTSHPKVIRVK
jgi:hypothetical protein